MTNEDLIKTNIKRIISKMIEKDIPILIDQYESCCYKPEDERLHKAITFFNQTTIELTTLRRVLCDYQSTFKGEWLKESPQKYAPSRVELFENTHGKGNFDILNLSDEYESILRQIESLFHPISSLHSMLNSALSSCTGILSKTANRKFLLSQDAMISDIKYLKEATNWLHRR